MDGSSSTTFVGATTNTGKLYKTAYDKMMGNTTPCSRSANLVSNVVLLAIFVVGCIGPTNILSCSTMGWIVVGLGCGYIGVKLLGGNLRSRTIDLMSTALVAAAIIALGALGCAGILTSGYVGYAVIGAILLTAVTSSYVMIVAKQRLDKALLKSTKKS